MIKPLMNRVLILPDTAAEKTASGLIIPNEAKEKPQTGKVMAVGPGLKGEAMTVKVDDTVLYGQFSGVEITFEDKTYMMIRESELYAIV
jgi:chaperonin GroES